MESKRLFGLDILRTTAIMLVVFMHGGIILKDSAIDGFPYFRLIDGVDIFFVLSGFLIGGILLKDINYAEKFSFKSLFTFWKRRWFRTLPNYYLILTVNFFFVKYGIINEDFSQFNWKFVFFLQNFSAPFYGFFWESWSLTIEEWFYILTPLQLLLFLRFMHPKKAFLLSTLFMILFPLFYRISILDNSISFFEFDSLFRKIVLTRLDSIAYGLLAAWAFYYYQALWLKYKNQLLIVGIFTLIFAINYIPEFSSFYLQVLYFCVSPISVMLLLPFAIGIKNHSGILAKSVTHISKISYSMYLINFSCIVEVMMKNFPPQNSNDSILKYGIYWFLVITISSLLYKYFEKPIMDLRDNNLLKNKKNVTV